MLQSPLFYLPGHLVRCCCISGLYRLIPSVSTSHSKEMSILKFFVNAATIHTFLCLTAPIYADNLPAVGPDLHRNPNKLTTLLFLHKFFLCHRNALFASLGHKDFQLKVRFTVRVTVRAVSRSKPPNLTLSPTLYQHNVRSPLLMSMLESLRSLTLKPKGRDALKANRDFPSSDTSVGFSSGTWFESWSQKCLKPPCWRLAIFSQDAEFHSQ